MQLRIFPFMPVPPSQWGKINSEVEFIFIKFIYSEKATKFCEIFPLLLTTVHTIKSKGKISQNFVAFSEYMNFIYSKASSSAAKPEPFFQVQPNLGPYFWVQMGRVGPQDPKTGQIGSGWPQKGLKFGFNPIMCLINRIWTWPDPGSKIGLRRVGSAFMVEIRVKFGSGWLGSFGCTSLELHGFWFLKKKEQHSCLIWSNPHKILQK